MHPSAARHILLLLVLASACSRGGQRVTAAAPELPRTRAERSNYTETSRYDDVVAFLKELESGTGRVASGTIGTTTEGRAIPYVIASRPLVRTPADARVLGRPIVYVQGNIHAGEVEGKEALQALLRNLVTAPRPNVLDSIVLIAVPIYNADGNERFAPQEQNRGAQNGPPLVGQRPNARGLDLNRDYIKAEAPETRASLAMFNAWDPDVFVDLHTTNGSYHGYALTYAPSLSPAAYVGGDDAPGMFAREVLLPELRRRVRDRHKFETFDYGNFNRDSVANGWFTYDHRPRYGTNYYGLRGRISMLSEAYSHDPFAKRVAATYAFVTELLSLIAERAADVERVSGATRDRLARASEGFPDVPVRAELTKTPRLADVVYERVETKRDSVRSEPGVPINRRRTGDFRTARIPVYDRFDAVMSRDVPWGYILAPGDSIALHLLTVHGARVDIVTAACRATGTTRFRGDTATLAANAFQGHREARVDGRWETVTEEVPLDVGARVVRMAQPLGLVAMYLLEPQSDDGLVAWNLGPRVTAAGGPPRLDESLAVRRLERPLPERCALRPRS